MTLPHVSAPLDPKIAPLVEALRRDGFATFASCDGKGGDPWVNVAVDDRRDGARVQTALVRWLRARGLAFSVLLGVWSAPVDQAVEREEVEERVSIRVEIYAGLEGAKL